MTEKEAWGQAFENGRRQGREECRKELLPCKMGDYVWGLRSYRGGIKIPTKGRVHQMYYGDDMTLCVCVKSVCRGVWGQQVFGSRQEAEAALALRRSGGGADRDR